MEFAILGPVRRDRLSLVPGMRTKLVRTSNKSVKFSNAVFLDLKDFEKIFHLTHSLEKNTMITPGDKKILKKFGENLRKLRKTKGLSLREMSYRCSIDNSKIAKIEKGMINITFTTLLQLAVALEMHPSSLMDYELE